MSQFLGLLYRSTLCLGSFPPAAVFWGPSHLLHALWGPSHLPMCFGVLTCIFWSPSNLLQIVWVPSHLTMCSGFLPICLCIMGSFPPAHVFWGPSHLPVYILGSFTLARIFWGPSHLECIFWGLSHLPVYSGVLPICSRHDFVCLLSGSQWLFNVLAVVNT